jgi:hypothetical protein
LTVICFGAFSDLRADLTADLSADLAAGLGAFFDAGFAGDFFAMDASKRDALAPSPCLGRPAGLAGIAGAKADKVKL